MANLTREPIDVTTLLAAVRRDSDGGIALFLGVARNHGGGHAVERLEYEAYEPMAEKELDRIGARLSSEHPGVHVLFQHRIGRLSIGEVAVAVVAAAPHRAEAFAACRSAIEAIKADVPIWKKEIGPDGVVWVDPHREGQESVETQNP